MTPMELLDNFLIAYAEYCGWKETKKKDILKKITENFSKDDKTVIHLAMGWSWGRMQEKEKMPYVSGEVVAGILHFKLLKIYNEEEE